MNKQPPSKFFTGSMNVFSPEIPDANPIQVRDWEFLRKEIQDIPSVKSIGLFSFLGSVLSGIAGTAFLSIGTLLGAQTSNSLLVFFWVIAIAATAIGIICFLFSYTTTKKSKNNAIKLMDHIQGTWITKEQVKQKGLEEGKITNAQNSNPKL